VKTKSKNQRAGYKPSGTLSLEQSDLAVNFYDVANGYPQEDFSQIAKRIVGIHGFGRSKTAAAFEREARRMFNLARSLEAEG
jgi:hypothetical protein